MTTVNTTNTNTTNTITGRYAPAYLNCEVRGVLSREEAYKRLAVVDRRGVCPCGGDPDCLYCHGTGTGPVLVPLGYLVRLLWHETYRDCAARRGTRAAQPPEVAARLAELRGAVEAAWPPEQRPREVCYICECEGGGPVAAESTPGVLWRCPDC